MSFKQKNDWWICKTEYEDFYVAYGGGNFRWTMKETDGCGSTYQRLTYRCNVWVKTWANE